MTSRHGVAWAAGGITGYFAGAADLVAALPGADLLAVDSDVSALRRGVRELLSGETRPPWHAGMRDHGQMTTPISSLSQSRTRRARAPRWGLRTLAFLGLSLACVMTSNVLLLQGNDDWVLVTFAGTVLGFTGATYCTVRGLLSVRGRSSRE